MRLPLSRRMLFEVEGQQIPPLEVDLAGNDAARRFADQPHDRKSGDAFAAAGLTDQAEVLALMQTKVDAIDGLCDAVAREEIRPETLDAEQIGLLRGCWDACG